MSDRFLHLRPEPEDRDSVNKRMEAVSQRDRKLNGAVEKAELAQDELRQLNETLEALSIAESVKVVFDNPADEDDPYVVHFEQSQATNLIATAMQLLMIEGLQKEIEFRELLRRAEKK